MATVNLFGDLALDNSVKATTDAVHAVTASKGTAVASDQKGVSMLAVRQDTDAATVSDGQLTPVYVDEEGRLKTSNKTASFAVTTGAVNALNATLVVDVRRASNIVLHVKNTGTVAMAAGAFAFEASLDSTNGTDGTWFTIQAARSNVNTVETGTGTLSIGIGLGLAYSWEASVNAYQYARVKCTTAVTTNSIAFWTIQRGSYATEPIPALQSHAVTGTVTANWGTLTTGTTYNVVTAASTNAAAVKASAGSIYEITISNTTATAAYVKLYNKTTAPTVGTDIPVLTIPVPASAANAGTVNMSFGLVGKRFATGIAIAVTAAAAATDTASTVAGIQINATYI